MKATGIVRRIDDLGRVVIPKEIRKAIRVHDGDPLEIYLEDDAVIFKKYKPYDDFFFRRVYDTLHKHFSSVAVYDCYNKVAGMSNTFPSSVPLSWSECNHSFDTDGYRVFPIFIGCDKVGYIASSASNNLDFIDGVVETIKSIETYGG